MQLCFQEKLLTESKWRILFIQSTDLAYNGVEMENIEGLYACI